MALLHAETRGAACGFMCGRYTHLLSWAEIVGLYRLTLPEMPPGPLKPNYNAALTTILPIIRPAGNTAVSW